MNINQIYIIHYSYIGNEQIRIDKYISKIIDRFPFQLSRSQMEKIFDEVKVNRKVVKRSYKLRYKDEVYIEFNAELINRDSKEEGFREDIRLKEYEKQFQDLNLLCDNEYFMAINKPRNMVVHPGAGHRSNTLSQIVFSELASYREKDKFHNRAGIVHRLDKDTSGVILIAKTAKIHDKLTRLFANREVDKTYVAIVHKEPRTRVGEIQNYIGRHLHHRKKFQVHVSEHRGKIAHTSFRVLFSNGDYSVILCEPHTGRTHQIRVHMQHIGCPIVGDSIYGRHLVSYSDISTEIDDDTECPLMLHALEINFALNIYDEIFEYSIKANVPNDMEKILGAFGVHL